MLSHCFAQAPFLVSPMIAERSAAPQTIENVQALRGVAALLVLYAHVRMLVHICDPAIPITPTGATGVDLFFVISGFVISLTASKRHHSAGDFILARLARVVPLYLAATLFHIAFHVAFPAASQSHFGFRGIWNGLFYLPVFDWGGYTTPPILVGWTLSFEMWFYLLFGFCLLFCTPTRAVAVFPLLFALGAFAGLWYRGDWYLPRFLLHPFALEFAFGCVVYQLRKHLTGVLPFLLLLMSALYFSLISRHYLDVAAANASLGLDMHAAWLRVLAWGVPMALLFAGIVGLELSRTYVLPQPLIWFGGISYSLYILHWPLLQMLGNIALHLHIHSPWIAAIVGTGSCLIAATLCHPWVELPLTTLAQKWARRLSGARSAPGPGLTVAPATETSGTH